MFQGAGTQGATVALPNDVLGGSVLSAYAPLGLAGPLAEHAHGDLVPSVLAAWLTPSEVTPEGVSRMRLRLG
ncbi:hypothetical protein GCM10020220_059920 [Nonomuraea rubra]